MIICWVFPTTTAFRGKYNKFCWPTRDLGELFFFRKKREKKCKQRLIKNKIFENWSYARSMFNDSYRLCHRNTTKHTFVGKTIALTTSNRAYEKYHIFKRHDGTLSDTKWDSSPMDFLFEICGEGKHKQISVFTLKRVLIC